MDLDLARKFLLEFLPPDAQVPVNDVFNELKTKPLSILQNGTLIGFTSYFQHESQLARASYINGFLTGFALAHCMEKHPEVAQMINHYLEHTKKAKGENVVSFLARKEK